MFLTVDGVMQGPGGPDEDRSGGFELGGWTANYWDDEMRQLLGNWINQAARTVLGRRTYEIFAAHWPFAPPDDPIAPKMNAMPKYVASRTLKRGKGKYLFAEGTVPVGFKLMDARPFSTVILQRYRPAGKPSLGSFALKHPPEVERKRRQRIAEKQAGA